MFIYSVRASSIRFFGVVALSVVALVTLIAFIPENEPTMADTYYSEVGAISFDKVKTAEDRIAFLKQFGWEVEEAPAEEKKVTIPAEFDRIFVGYNELQKQQGLDLSKYKRKEATRYTYKVLNYEGYDGTVYANIIVYRNKVIAGDICSADIDGFVTALDGKTKPN